ncbi:MAG: hypothetical protein SFT81_00070 [Candidatus Caenarcaniphilales bacterium]|nr:hypothetical protein [Candidatus Caenarcaniphilales bacterium]
MTMTESDRLIVLKGLEGNEAANYLSPIQFWLLDYTPLIIICYWCFWIGSLVYLFTRYVLLPSWKALQEKQINKPQA